jgi:hypothetical protein
MMLWSDAVVLFCIIWFILFPLVTAAIELVEKKRKENKR